VSPADAAGDIGEAAASRRANAGESGDEHLLASLPSRISDIAFLGARRWPHAAALRDARGAWTYAELATAVEATRKNLADAGVRPGDRVLVASENAAATVVLLLAIATLDAWAVIVNARLSPREVDAIRDHCRPRRSLYLADVSPEAGAHAKRHGAFEVLSLGGMGKVVMGELDTHCAPEATHADSARQTAALVYTSGTTGDPKGVMLSHRNLLYIARVSSTLRALDCTDTVYGVLPVSHVYGLASVCLGTLKAGACLLLEPRFSPEAMLDAITRRGVTVLQGVPSMYARLGEHIRARGPSIVGTTLRLLYAGGSPLDPGLKAATEQLFGLTLHNGYGLTEAAPTISQTRLHAPRSDCSVGMVIPGCEIRIVDAAGRAVVEREPGALHVRGPNVMLGYYRNPSLTAATIDSEGWLDTGDLARQDADGALFIVGRTKELIIRSGFNVYPIEVESVLNAHPSVLQSAVVGREVESNEEVIAFVELVPGSSTSVESLLEFCVDRLAPYKRPSEIVLTSLPLASNGKVQKRLLKTMARQRSPEGVA